MLSLHTRAASLALPVLFLLTACFGSESSDGRTFSELLEWIPDSRATQEDVLLVNLETLRRTTGVTPTADPADLDQLIAYQERLNAGSGRADFEPIILDQNVLDEPTYENFGTYLRLDYADVDLVAESGQPPNRLYLAGGRFDADAAETALLECDGCFEPTDQYERGGVTYYGWGIAREQNLRERFSPPMYDALGRGGRLFLSDEIAVKTQTNGLMEAAIGAGLDDERSLADVDDFRLATAALDREDAWLATLTRLTLGPAFWNELGDFVLDFVDPQVAERLDEQWNPSPDIPLLREHQLFAAGAVATADEPYLVLVLVHETAEDAEASVEPLRRRINELDSATSDTPWREIITSAEIETDGRLLIARLHGLDFWDFWNNADPLTLHE